MAAVLLEKLTKVYQGPGKQTLTAVRDVCLSIQEREFFVLLGPSGCGKTTILRMIAGLEDPTAGAITIDGMVANGVAPGDRDIAMVFQNYALYPHMSVYDNLAFGLKLRKVARAEIAARVKEVAEILELSGSLNRNPDELSGGQRQRVAVGRAMVRKPKVFLFDEPLSNLDANLRAQLRAEISRLHARLPATMIYVTHDQAEGLTLGDRVAVMNEGAVQQIDDPATLYQRPANLFVAGFIGSPPMNFFNGAIQRGERALMFQAEPSAAGATPVLSVELPEHLRTRVENYAGKPVVLGIRPEHIAEAASPARPSSRPLAAVVEVVQHVGSENHVYLKCGKHSFVARFNPAKLITVGQQVTVEFDLSQAHLFDQVSGLRID